MNVPRKRRYPRKPLPQRHRASSGTMVYEVNGRTIFAATKSGTYTYWRYPTLVVQEQIDDGLVPEWITKPGVYLLP